MKEEWKDRVKEERNLLNRRIIKLNRFITKTSKFFKLSQKHQNFLVAQLSTMKIYRNILTQRLKF